jgi:hypothetical protein
MYVIAQEEQRKELGSGAIADGETDAKNASVDSPSAIAYVKTDPSAFLRIADGTTDVKSTLKNSRQFY